MEIVKEIFSIVVMIYSYYFEAFRFLFEFILPLKYAGFLASYIHILLPVAFLARRIYDTKMILILKYHYGIYIYTFLLTALHSSMIEDKGNYIGMFFVFVIALYGIMNVRYDVMTTAEGVRRSKNTKK